MKTHEELVTQVVEHEGRIAALESNLPEEIKRVLRDLASEAVTLKNLTKAGSFLVVVITVAEKLGRLL